MKLHLPFILLGCLTAVLAAKSAAETTLTGDTILTGTQVQDTKITEEYAVHYDGQGVYALDFVQKENEEGNGSFFQLKSTSSSSLSLSFSNLSHLGFSGAGAEMPASWLGPVSLQNLGDARFTIENVSGDVSFSDFSGGKIQESLVYVWSQRADGDTEATIRIADVSGKLSISRNSATDRSDMFVSVGFVARVSPREEGISNALINLSNIGDGIEISDNTKGGSAGYAGLLATVNTGLGLSSITIDSISGGIKVTNNKTSDMGIFFSMAGSQQWNPPNHELVSGVAAMKITNVQGGILFENNSAYGSGGLMLLARQCLLEISGINGDVLFLGNSSSVGAGAIYCSPDARENDPARSEVRLSADGGNIIFAGNKNTEQNVANAMLIGKNTDVCLNAAAGRMIAFYDPIEIDDDGNTSIVHLNEGAESQGEILFSGRDYADSDNAANYTSTLTGDAFQYNGTVRLDQRAALQLVNYVQEGGTLTMGRQTSLSASGNVSLKTLTLDLTLSGEPASITAAGSASANQVNVYAPSSAVTPGETVLTITADSFGGILQETGDHRVSMWNDQGMNLVLEMNWELNDEGALVFTTGNIVEEGVIAELQGSNIANSMLSSAASLRSFTGTGLEHLDTARFLSPLKSNVWTSGLGDFQMQRTKGGIEGFDYQGGGFAVGGDYRLGQHWLGGVAYGYTSGKNISREYQATNRQNTNMGLIYTGWRLPMDKGQALTVTAAAGFGSTDNHLSSVTSGGQNSSGSWTNRAWEGTVRAAWDLPVGRNLVLTPHIGVEYTDVVQEAFRESGEMARRFDRGHYRNLSLPVGLSLTRGLTLGGMPWSHTVSVEYLPDVYRSNAGTYARLVGNGYGWGVEGSKPARQGVRAGISGRLQVTNNWSAYGSYQVEARDSLVNQRVMLGVGYSF